MMNIKKYLFTVLCSGFIILSGCDENKVNLVGSGIQPNDDKIAVYADTFQITASTVRLDSLYAKTTVGLLGEIYDPLYGRLKSDYLCQFYCQDDYQFKYTPYKNKIDSIYLRLYYTTIGDLYAPMQIQIFPVIKQLDKVYYTNVNPGDYCDIKNPLGTLVYTASNGKLDSMKVGNTFRYFRSVNIRLPIELGQKIYNETINNPSSFKDQSAFNQFFPGVYVTTNYGSGSVLNIEGTEMYIDYNYAIKSSTEEDSLIHANERFLLSKEVIQLNRFENSDTEQLLADNKDYTFLKTPAGIYTRLVIPTKEIAPIIEGRIVNSLSLNLKYMPHEDWLYALDPPSYLLLMPEDSLRTFFENRSIENNITTFISFDGNSAASSSSTTDGYSQTTRTYYFQNISNLLNVHIKDSPDKDLRLLVVPVNRIIAKNNNGYYTTSIDNYLAPSGIKLRKDKESMKITVLSSKYQ